MKLRAKHLATLPLAVVAAGCQSLGYVDDDFDGNAPAQVSAATSDPTGPAGDYPVVIGPAYEINGVTYTPEDTLNYDEVGYAAADTGAALGITAAHHTLPVPSYVEVTELDEGRTILVRVERRGPMDSNRLVALSPAAMRQLGISGVAPVRVRRVNPPEVERAELRIDQPAPERISTPEGLLTVLRRKLPNAPTVASIRPAPVPPVVATRPAPQQSPPPVVTPTPAPPQPVPTVTQQPTGGAGYYVQAGAYSKRDNAERVAASIGGTVYPSGRLFRVRSGPFDSSAEANRDLSRVKAAGFGDARIVRED